MFSTVEKNSKLMQFTFKACLSLLFICGFVFCVSLISYSFFIGRGSDAIVLIFPTIACGCFAFTFSIDLKRDFLKFIEYYEKHVDETS